MIRLTLVWFVLTAIVFGFRFFVDSFHKRETARWTTRFLGSGVLVAFILCAIIFIERL